MTLSEIPASGVSTAEPLVAAELTATGQMEHALEVPLKPLVSLLAADKDVQSEADELGMPPHAGLVGDL